MGDKQKYIQHGSAQEHTARQVNYLMELCHGLADEAGWWEDLETGEKKSADVPRLLMLAVSELSEAMEGDRKQLMDDHLPHRKMVEVELADSIIRILDMSGGMGLDIGGAVAEKLAYNAKRADHKLENRRADGGKNY